MTAETDGFARSISQAVRSIENNVKCLALLGSVGDGVAVKVIGVSSRSIVTPAHVTPRLQSSSHVVDNKTKTFSIFAQRQAQVGYALRTLSLMGLKKLGVVYGTFRDDAARHQELQTIATGL